MFLGQQKVKEVKEGNGKVIVTVSELVEEKDVTMDFEMSKELYGACATEEPIDYHSYHVKRSIFLAEQCWRELMKHNCHIDEVKSVLNRIDTTVDDKKQRKLHSLLNKKEVIPESGLYEPMGIWDII